MNTTEEARRRLAETIEQAYHAFNKARRRLRDLKPGFWDALGELLQVTRPWRLPEDVPSCCVCGCTEDAACEGGCWWVEDIELRDRCSQCVAKPVPDRDQLCIETFRRAYRQLGAPGDFGYDLPEGQALKRLYDTYSHFLSARRTEADARAH